MSESIAIHDIVKERYGAIASAQTGSCCGPANSLDCGCNTQLYDTALLEGLPADVTNISLGCGDPVSIASLKPGEIVLDLGSGGGIDCFLAARQVGDSGYVIGVDMTPAMLMKANSNKVNMGVHNVEFRRGQIEALPVTANSIDVIISNCVINLSPDKDAVFREVVRVLRPGGRFHVADVVLLQELSEAQQGDLNLWAGCVSGALLREEYVERLQRAGMTNVVISPANGDEGWTDQAWASAIITAERPASE